MRKGASNQNRNGSTLITMRDVAREAGVSIQTVSNVVNGRQDMMATETLDRVRAAMQQLGYHPNAHARGLRSQQTRTLGFLTVDPSARFLADPFHSAIMSGMADVLRENDYYLLVDAVQPGRSGHSFETLFYERRIDGALGHLSGLYAQREAYVGELERTGCPFVLIEEHVACPTGAAVLADNREGACQAVRYLVEKGHTDIAFLSGATAWPAVEERLSGYQQALEASGLSVRSDRIIEAPWSQAHAQAAIAGVLRSLPSVTAILCANDLLAVGAVAAAKSIGRAVPGDLAVIGFDDFEFAAFVDPPLTTVALPGYEMGARAAELLLGFLQDSRFPEREVVFPATLTLRNSA